MSLRYVESLLLLQYILFESCLIYLDKSNKSNSVLKIVESFVDTSYLSVQPIRVSEMVNGQDKKIVQHLSDTVFELTLDTIYLVIGSAALVDALRR